MPSHGAPTAKNASILIVGGGVFGLSSALQLSKNGYTNITVIDREAVPSPYSAGNDLNKIVRAEYEDPFYAKLALNAIKQWQTPFWAPYYKPTGYLVAISPDAPQKARDSLQKSLASIKNDPAFKHGSFTAIGSAKDAKGCAPMLNGNMEGWSGYFNRHAGYARAAKALEHAAKTCNEMGVKFVTGDNGYAVELQFRDELQGRRICTGVKTTNGTIYQAAQTILCLGAHIGTLLPEISYQVMAKAWSVAHIQLSAEEVEEMKDCPVVNCRDLGFFFEPDEDTGLLKLSANGAGYTNYVTSPGFQEQISIPTPSVKGIPKEDEELIKRLISNTMPKFSGRQLVNKFICWCGDTAESDFIIDFLPGVEGLMVAGGDSGHAFKMLPVVGEWVANVIMEGEQSITRWKWKDGKASSDDISWRVGTVRDIKEAMSLNTRSQI
ncbi:uncharacterized protein BP5553_08487 [Venustampulla echinocandica]|uniref:FAD dependent oxidoreductase domain-containing protein n=1 Tax=Venustampulla echinocandica TaxID=2656787 RepID=A0A370TED6_9HELO|nr:uncharacterized protein BP5553_08487 [Venustampulla echinocandica]RDL33048.1 hypothetical protein BP5553_08487 [Venustampulla echinocandica]